MENNEKLMSFLTFRGIERRTFSFYSRAQAPRFSRLPTVLLSLIAAAVLAFLFFGKNDVPMPVRIFMAAIFLVPAIIMGIIAAVRAIAEIIGCFQIKAAILEQELLIRTKRGYIALKPDQIISIEAKRGNINAKKMSEMGYALTGYNNFIRLKTDIGEFFIASKDQEKTCHILLAFKDGARIENALAEFKPQGKTVFAKNITRMIGAFFILCLLEVVLWVINAAYLPLRRLAGIGMAVVGIILAALLIGGIAYAIKAPQNDDSERATARAKDEIAEAKRIQRNGEQKSERSSVRTEAEARIYAKEIIKETKKNAFGIVAIIVCFIVASFALLFSIAEIEIEIFIFALIAYSVTLVMLIDLFTSTYRTIKLKALLSKGKLEKAKIIDFNLSGRKNGSLIIEYYNDKNERKRHKSPNWHKASLVRFAAMHNDVTILRYQNWVLEIL